MTAYVFFLKPSDNKFADNEFAAIFSLYKSISMNKKR